MHSLVGLTIEGILSPIAVHCIIDNRQTKSLHAQTFHSVPHHLELLNVYSRTVRYEMSPISDITELLNGAKSIK